MRPSVYRRHESRGNLTVNEGKRGKKKRGKVTNSWFLVLEENAKE